MEMGRRRRRLPTKESYPESIAAANKPSYDEDSVKHVKTEGPTYAPEVHAECPEPEEEYESEDVPASKGSGGEMTSKGSEGSSKGSEGSSKGSEGGSGKGGGSSMGGSSKGGKPAYSAKKSKSSSMSMYKSVSGKGSEGSGKGYHMGGGSGKSEGESGKSGGGESGKGGGKAGGAMYSNLSETEKASYDNGAYIKGGKSGGKGSRRQRRRLGHRQ
jgi:hypothetical protein